jgi:hypothetical protein
MQRAEIASRILIVLLPLQITYHSRITVVVMTGVEIVIDDASVADTVLSVKERVFIANRKLPVRRQRLVYRPGPRGMEALADDETLGGAGVARDGTAKLDLLLVELTQAEAKELGQKVCSCVLLGFYHSIFTAHARFRSTDFRCP